MAPLLRSHWTLDESVTFLNHGSFGACPRAALDAQLELRAELEREPVRFFVDRLEPLLDGAREAVGAFVGADPDDLAFVTNATAGVNTVLRSLTFAGGDELVTTDHAYNACKNALDYVAARAGAKVVVARVPFPLREPQEVVDAVLGACTRRTRIVMIDHVTSPTALVFPVERLVAALKERGILTLIDGAHVPGMLPLDLDALGADYYTANLHKWGCAPKGAAFLWVRRDRQAEIRPLSISHGANNPRKDRSRFRLEFDWTGTDDPTAWMASADALRVVGAMLPGGWPEIMRRNHALAVEGRRLLMDALGLREPPAPESMLGSMASIPLPDATTPPAPPDAEPLHLRLIRELRIEVPIFVWPAHPKRLLRIATPLYVERADVERLAAALPPLLRP